MPEANDCTFDALVEHYADLNLERMDRFQKNQYIRNTLIDFYSSMTKNSKSVLMNWSGLVMVPTHPIVTYHRGMIQS